MDLVEPWVRNLALRFLPWALVLRLRTVSVCCVGEAISSLLVQNSGKLPEANAQVNAMQRSRARQLAFFVTIIHF